MRVAVTAASGQLGSHIVQALGEFLDADQIVGLARSPEKASSLGVKVRPGDYSVPKELESSLAGVDSLLLVSGMAPPDERIDQHRNVISAAVAAGVKKIVYTSIQGSEEGTAFSPIVLSNRQTEKDIHASGLDWSIGRNGIYIEPDVDYIDIYRSAGKIANCAGDGRCGYTTRGELGYAYARMLTDSRHDGQTFNLHGEAITQQQLAEHLNRAFGLTLQFQDMSVEEYRAERQAELGKFLGTVIAGIYEGIRNGAVDNPSNFEAAAGRPHIDWADYFAAL
jgi:NAD(P)H dehydrogenase (quinone)